MNFISNKKELTIFLEENKFIVWTKFDDTINFENLKPLLKDIKSQITELDDSLLISMRINTLERQKRELEEQIEAYKIAKAIKDYQNRGFTCELRTKFPL